MRTVYTTSLYSTEVTRKSMDEMLHECKHNGVLDRAEFNRKLQDALLNDSDPDMNEREFESLQDASNSTNHRAEADYYTSSVSYFRLSGRVIEEWKYRDDEEPTFKEIAEIDNFDDEAIDKILEQFPYGDMRGNWYAVQETTEDAWDDGSYDWDEAVALANERGYDIIAEIDESGTDSYCVAEYHRGTDF